MGLVGFWSGSPSLDRVFGISVISCWEVAKLVEYGRLKLDRAVGLWLESALAESGVSLLHLHPRIVVESTQLPQPFHRDPADQLLVGESRKKRARLHGSSPALSTFAAVGN